MSTLEVCRLAAVLIPTLTPAVIPTLTPAVIPTLTPAFIPTLTPVVLIPTRALTPTLVIGRLAVLVRVEAADREHDRRPLDAAQREQRLRLGLRIGLGRGRGRGLGLGARAS